MGDTPPTRSDAAQLSEEPVVDQHPPPQDRTAAGEGTPWEAWRAAWRHPDGTKRRTPAWALAVLLVTTGLLVPGFLVSNSEDAAMSSTTTAVQRAGGETVTSNRGGDVCRDAPLELEVGGTRYAGTTPVGGECLSSGETREVTVRYDPDDPETFTANDRQYLLYGFAGAAALGFVVTLVAVLRRLWARYLRRPPPGTPRPERKPLTRTRKVLLGLGVVALLGVVAGAVVVYLESRPPGRAERQQVLDGHYVEEVEIVETDGDEVVRLDGRPRPDCEPSESGYLECSEEPRPTLTP